MNKIKDIITKISNNPKLIAVVVFGLGAIIGAGSAYAYYKYKKYEKKESYYEKYDEEYREERHRKGERRGMHDEQEEEEMLASGCGDTRPGEYIQFLFNNRKAFTFTNEFDDKNLRLKWEIKAKEDNLKTLKEHIEQMGCLLSKGFTPRRWDPAFVAEQKVKKYVKTKVYIKDGTLYVDKQAENRCAYEVIKLHAKIVEGFFTRGRAEAEDSHSVDNILSLCAKEGVEIN